MARTNIEQLGLLCLYGKIVARHDRFVIDQQSHRIPEKVISIAMVSTQQRNDLQYLTGLSFFLNGSNKNKALGYPLR